MPNVNSLVPRSYFIRRAADEVRTGEWSPWVALKSWPRRHKADGGHFLLRSWPRRQEPTAVLNRVLP
jgi:hypothetical protein